jgi:hypothetical protein
MLFDFHPRLFRKKYDYVLHYDLDFFTHPFQHQIKSWVKPTTLSLAIGALTDLSRSRAELMVENTLLRKQFIVLHRQIKRPNLTKDNCFRLVLLACCTNSGIMHSSLSNLIHSFAGIECYSAFIGVIYRRMRRLNKEYLLKRSN